MDFHMDCSEADQLTVFLGVFFSRLIGEHSNGCGDPSLHCLSQTKAQSCSETRQLPQQLGYSSVDHMNVYGSNPPMRSLN